MTGFISFGSLRFRYICVILILKRLIIKMFNEKTTFHVEEAAEQHTVITLNSNSGVFPG